MREVQIFMRFQVMGEAIRHEIVLRYRCVSDAANAVCREDLPGHCVDFLHKAMNTTMVVEVVFSGIMVFFTDPGKTPGICA